MTAPHEQACIVGIGQTEFSKASGRSEQQLAAEAILAACQDAGINPADIDGMTTFNIDNSDEVDVCLLYTSPSPRDLSTSRMPSSA